MLFTDKGSMSEVDLFVTSQWLLLKYDGHHWLTMDAFISVIQICFALKFAII